MSILRLLATRPLPCGCIVGVYETYAGPIHAVIETRGERCTSPAHEPGRTLSPMKAATLTPVPARPPAREAS